MNRDHPNDDLGALLRHGDPADDRSEPTPEEAALLRRTVLDSAGTSAPIDRRSARRMVARWLPLAAAVAAALYAAVLLVPGAPMSRESRGRPPAGEPPAGEPEHRTAARQLPTGPSPTARTPPGLADAPTPETAPRPLRDHGGNRSVEVEPSVSGIERSPRTARQIRFATARGTQIIWVLDPELDL